MRAIVLKSWNCLIFPSINVKNSIHENGNHMFVCRGGSIIPILSNSLFSGKEKDVPHNTSLEAKLNSSLPCKANCPDHIKSVSR